MTPNMTLNRWRAVLDLYGGDVFLDRITIEAGRLVTFNMIVQRHCRHDETNPGTWLNIRHDL